MGISSTGIGSGLDVNSIISQLMAVEKRPLTMLQTKASGVQTQLSVYGNLQSRITTLGDAAKKLADPSSWMLSKSTSSDAASVSVSSTDTAAATQLDVSITKLAQAQSAASGVYASKEAAVGTGTLRIELGQWSEGYAGFTPKSGATAIDITIGSDEQSLAAIRDKINAADAGVTATILNDSTGSRLVLRANETGAVNGFRITVTDTGDANNTDAAGLSALALDPPSGTAMTATQRGSDLEGTVNGSAITSASNQVENLVEGVTITANKVTTSPVNIAVASATAAIKSMIQQFATAYSDSEKFLREQTAYNADTKTAGALQGDRTAVSLQNRLRTLLGTSTGASTAFARLSDIGLELQRDGSIKINDSKLDAALSGNLSEVAKLFSNADAAHPANEGLARQFAALAAGNVGTDGALIARGDGLRERLKHNQNEQDKFAARLDSVEARLRAQYSALDARMGQLAALSAYMTQQTAMWSNNSKNNN